MAKVRFWKFRKETRFLMDILIKFTFISPQNRKFLTNEINLLLALNCDKTSKCREKNYTNEEVSDFSKGLFKTPHEILNPTPGETVLGDSDKTGNYVLIENDSLLLYSLNYFKARTKDEIKKKNEDLGFSFYKEEYIFYLIKNSHTKQSIKYLAKLILLKCSENKAIFDIVLSLLIRILDELSDMENSFFDESDPESEAEIYKNYGQNLKEYPNKILKKNVSFIFKKLATDVQNNKLSEYKQKSCLSKLFSFYSKNKKYYSRAITVINILLNIFESTNIDTKKYLKDLNDILNWLNKFSVPPKHYEIKGINMYKDLPAVYHSKVMDDKQKAEFEKKEKEKTILKIERMKRIILNKKKEYNIANFDGDLSDFKFTFGDVVLFQEKEYVVTNCLDEMIRVKLIEKEKKNKWEDVNLSKKTNEKKLNISQKEKIKFWIEKDHYQLRIKNLVPEDVLK